jgi:son of sevenless
MALYDIGKGIKVSEDFHYFINPSEEPIPSALEKELSNTDNCCLFSVNEPTISTYLVLSVERILLGPYNDAILPYTKKLSQSDKLKIKNAYSKSNDLAKYRQTLMWGYAKLFYPREDVKMEDYPDPFMMPGKLIIGTIEISPMYKIPQESKRIDFLDLMMFRKGISAEDLEKKYGIDGCFTYSIDLMYDSNAVDTKHSNGLTKLDPDRFSTTEKLLTSYNYAFEFPDLDVGNPYLTFFNNLYIYPQSFTSSIKDKKPSIVVLVQFKSSDDSVDVPSDSVFRKRYNSKESTNFAISSVSYGAKIPYYYEEIKVGLPVVFNQNQHILFTFYNVLVDDVKPTEEDDGNDPLGKAKKELIGYSFFPISDNGYIVGDVLKTLEVHKTLKKNYLTIMKKNWDLTKCTFDVQFKVDSSVYPRDFSIKNFYSYTHFIEKHKPFTKEMDSFLNGLCRSLEQMNRSKYDGLLQYFPQLMNEAIYTFLTVGSKTKDQKLIESIHQTGFVALLAITKDLAKDSVGKRNKDLCTFVEYHMDEFPTQKPMYIFMLELMSKYLEMEEEKLNDTVDQKNKVKETTEKNESVVDSTDLLNYCYFYFDIILKSVAISTKKTDSQLASDGKTMGWIKDFMLANKFEDELKKFIFLFCVQMCNHPDVNVGKFANRQLALFIKSLIPILQSSQIPAIFSNYLDCLDMYSGSMMQFKVDFFHIIFDSDNILAMLCNSKTIADKYIATLIHCVELESNVSLREKSIFYFVDHLTKLDYDSRYQDQKAKNFISDAYWGLINALISKEDLLQYCFVNEGLEYLLIAVIWLLSNKDEEKLLAWYQKLSMEQITNLFRLLNSTVFLFSSKDFQKDEEKKPDLKKFEEAQKRTTETIFAINHLIGVLLTNSKDMFASFKQEGNTFDLMNSICELFMNLLLNRGQNKEFLTVLSNQKDGFSRYDSFVKLSKFLELFISELVVTEEDVKDIKVGKIQALQKLESNWRKLVGAVLANVTHPVKKTHPIIFKCLSALLEPYYSAVNLQVKSIDTDETDELFDKDVIKAGSVEKLIKYIFDKKERNYEKMFLLTYFSFTKPKDLLITLICLYQENFKNEESGDRLRLLGFLSDWVKNGYHNFDNTVIAILIKFLDDDLLTTKYNTTQNKMKRYIINKLVDGVDEKQQTVQQQRDPEVPKGFDIELMSKPKIPFKQFNKNRKLKNFTNPFDYSFNILEWSSTELAIQLTLIEMDLFKSIEPKECFGLAWSKSNKLDMAPNIVGISERFNKVSDWIQAVILNEQDVKIRQSLVMKFLEIAKICRSEVCYNFTTVNQITAALNTAAVYRLKKTFEILKNDDMKTFENLSNLFSKPPYNELRAALKDTAGYPTVPFIGVYLTELTFIEEGNPDFTAVGDKKLVNFFKRRLFADTLLGISLFQQNVYKYTELPYLKYILTEEIFELPVYDDKQSFNQSLVIEPRKK